MIITKELHIEINTGNKAHFQKITFTKLNIGDVIFVPIDKITTGSNYKIEVQCGCGQIKPITYKEYTKRIKVRGNYTCINCSNPFNSKIIQNKIKKTNLEKYGFDNPAKSSKIKDKIKNTFVEKYGVENISHLQETKDKIKQKHFELFGVDNAFKSESIKDEIKKNNFEKYGVENYTSTKECKEKISKTCMFKYGVTTPFKSKHIQYKIKQTNLEKYGVENPFSSKEIQDKIKQTNLEKYGVENPSQNPILYKKYMLKGYRIHKFENTNLTYQGTYELDFLYLCKFKNIPITQDMDSISYVYNGLNKKYHPDYYYEPLNLIIEIKSTYIYNMLARLNKAKEVATINAGYNYIIIMDKNYDIFLDYINI